MIGQTISHYKILEKLGEGGMGVVYKAHDTKLDRDVALKFLPRDVSLSEEERSRFIHEAKAASALEHPNICTIHEVDETPDGQMFIVMGYYEGDSLSKKIEKGRLDVAEAVWIAIQIAEGLQAAHEKGIIHRDIKSSNVIVSDKNQVRILDFGLAHKKGLSKLTKTGTTVGTASYMSPEQAQGGKIDHRTDLWSLGVILYEMVTGKLPFRGEHEAAILYSVVNEEPQPIQAIVPDDSPELVHIIRRALEKDPAERYHSAADLLIDLRRLKKDTSRSGFPPVSGEKKRLSSRRNKIIIAVCVLALLCVVGYLYFFKKGVEINPNFTQRTIEVPFKQVSPPAISPDGNYLVFGGSDGNNKWHLYIVSLLGGEPRQLTQDTIGIGQCQFSPDGHNIVYRRGEERDICIVPFIGGISKKIGIGVLPKWSPDGKRIGYILYFPGVREQIPLIPLSKSGNGEFWTMNPDGTDKRLEFIDTISAKAPWDRLSFAWSPDGRSVAWMRSLPSLYCEIVIHNLQSGNETRLIADTTVKSEICWASNDQIIYYSSTKGEGGGNLWTVSAKGGDPIQITKGSNYVNYPTISVDGKKLTYRQEINIAHLWIARLDGSNQHVEVTSEEGYYGYPAISPDGKQIVYRASMPSKDEEHLYIVTRDGTNKRQLTFGQTNNWGAFWSPDGKLIAYNSYYRYQPPESAKVYVLNIESPETPMLIHPGFSQGWRDSVTLEIEYQNKIITAYLDGRPAQKFSEDSIYAYSILDNKYVFFIDGHTTSEGVWKVCKAEDWDGKGPSSSWAIWKGATSGISRNQGIYFLKNKNELLHISFLDGKQEKIPVTFPKIDLYHYRIRVTQDDKELIYKTIESTSKLGIIENLFK